MFPLVRATAAIGKSTATEGQIVNPNWQRGDVAGEHLPARRAPKVVSSAGGQRDSSRIIWSGPFMEPSSQKLTEETENAKNSLLSPLPPVQFPRPSSLETRHLTPETKKTLPSSLSTIAPPFASTSSDRSRFPGKESSSMRAATTYCVKTGPRVAVINISTRTTCGEYSFTVNREALTTSS